MNENLKRNLGMTVGDLRAALRSLPDNLPVHFAHDYGDHCHTTVAPPVQSVTRGAVAWSDYCSSPAVDEAGTAEDATAAVILEVSA